MPQDSTHCRRRINWDQPVQRNGLLWCKILFGLIQELNSKERVLHESNNQKLGIFSIWEVRVYLRNVK
jgi:hypothetical protein